MGISSAGYVAGKLARGPGPKIVSMTGQVIGRQLALKIDGTALGTKGASYLLADMTPATPVDKTVTLTDRHHDERDRPLGLRDPS